MDTVACSSAHTPRQPVVSDDPCYICLEPLDSRNNVATVRTQCGHQFDLNCITQWQPGQ